MIRNNVFVTASKRASEVADMEELKGMMSVTLKVIKKDVDTMSVEAFEEQLELWIRIQNNESSKPYIVGGSPDHNATNLEELIEEYMSQKDKGASVLNQAIRNIENAREFLAMLNDGFFDEDFMVAKDIFSTYVANYRAEMLLKRMRATIDAIES